MASPTNFPITCPGCGSVYTVPLDLAGADVTCQICNTDFSLPDILTESLLHDLLPAGRPAAPLGIIRSSSPDLQLTPDPGADAFATGPEEAEEAALASPPARGRSRWWQSFLLFLVGAGIILGLYPFLKDWTTQLGSPSKEPSAADDSSTPPAPTGPQIPHRTLAIVEPEPAPPLEPVIAAPSPAIVAALRVPTAQEKSPVSLPSEQPPMESVQTLPPPEIPADQANAGSTTESVVKKPPELPVARKAIPIPEESDFEELRKDSRKTLERFLVSSTPAERLEFCQRPEQVRAEIETYYQDHPASPLTLEQLTLLAEDRVPGTTLDLHLYNVFLKDKDSPIPVSVEQTKDGFRVDWQSFIESYEHRLRAFFSKPVKEPARFRVLLRRAHYFGPPVPGMGKERLAYSVEPPMRDETFNVWADKNSRVFREKLGTGERANWEAESYVVVELIWQGDGGSSQWVSIQNIVSDSWRLE